MWIVTIFTVWITDENLISFRVLSDQWYNVAHHQYAAASSSQKLSGGSSSQSACTTQLLIYDKKKNEENLFHSGYKFFLISEYFRKFCDDFNQN